MTLFNYLLFKERMMTTTNHRIDHHDADERLCNTSDNPEFYQVLAIKLKRREFLIGSLGLAFLTLPKGAALAGETPLPTTSRPASRLGFNPVAVSDADKIILPEGYQYQVILPFGSRLPHPDLDLKIGSHHDGMHFFPIYGGNDEGILVLNHEYIEPRFLHNSYQGRTFSSSAVYIDADGHRDAKEVFDEMAAHGVTVVHIKRDEQGEWLPTSSPLNRRIDATTPMQISGPARGHDKMRTPFSPDGTQARGTINNCAHGVTPWGTYLTCEENWAGYFYNPTSQPREQQRYGVRNETSGRYAWERAKSSAAQADLFQRFKADDAYINEPNQFGWVVEIDPLDPHSTPIKRTALGRFAHEGVIFRPAVDGQPIECYMGDDARFEYIYRYVSDAPYSKQKPQANLLDEGTLYAAKFHADGHGEWLPLVYGQGPLTAANGFDSQGDVLINTRLAADLVGATKMDRPEWGAIDPDSGEVYFTLTNNTRRQAEQVDAANPRAANPYGHIIRWQESATQPNQFDWNIFLLAGDQSDSEFAGAPLNDTNQFNAPDGLWFDKEGRLWIQTDMSERVLNTGDFEAFGNNQMLACDPVSGDLRRFLVGPIGQEITGITATPDGKTLFINVQHPGATTSPDAFKRNQFSSRWPMGYGVPRSATVVITKTDGGVIGT